MSQSTVGSTGKSTQRAQSARPSPSGPLQPSGPTGSTSPTVKAGSGGRRPVSSSPLKGNTTPVRGFSPGVGPHPWQQQPGVGKLVAGGGLASASSSQIPGAAAADSPAAVSTLAATGAHVNDGPRGAALHLQVRWEDAEDRHRFVLLKV